MMKIIGACFVLLGCGGYGLYLAYTLRLQVKMLKQLVAALDYMECELVYRQTPLPDMLANCANLCSGRMATVFLSLVQELEKQSAPDAAACMAVALRNSGELPVCIYDCFVLLGRNLGCFDAEGQLKGIRSVRSECERTLQAHISDQDSRVRTYQTLGVCAGAAIIILFI